MKILLIPTHNQIHLSWNTAIKGFVWVGEENFQLVHYPNIWGGGYWCLNSELLVYKAGALLLDPCLHPSLL
jgi:hypothetical protein